MNSLLEILIIAAIVGIAAWYLIRRFINSLKPNTENACGCGCSGCGSASEYTDGSGIMSDVPGSSKSPTNGVG
jgi:hypothetical protein